MTKTNSFDTKVTTQPTMTPDESATSGSPQAASHVTDAPKDTFCKADKSPGEQAGAGKFVRKQATHLSAGATATIKGAQGLFAKVKQTAALLGAKIGIFYANHPKIVTAGGLVALLGIGIGVCFANPLAGVAISAFAVTGLVALIVRVVSDGKRSSDAKPSADQQAEVDQGLAGHADAPIAP